MNHEHEQGHATSTAATAATNDNDTDVPGQTSRSALLRKRDHAVASGLVQRKARDAHGVADGPEHAVAAASSTSSSPLPDTLMRKFESSLGADLSGVRTHIGDASARAAEAREGAATDGGQHAADASVADDSAKASGPDAATQHKVQRKASEGDAVDVHQAAALGISGSGGPLPHLDAIQRSFGRHDVSQVQAHTDGAAAAGAAAMGAEAFATGDHVAFRHSPSLHTAAHEAAHVVQQRGGVHLKGGVGQVGDPYEQHADSVADRVVQGVSAEALLDQVAGHTKGGGGNVQRKTRHKVTQIGKTRFLQLCGLCTTVIMRADGRMEAWLASIANAYATAWTTHTALLKDQDRSNRLAGNLILGAALAFIPGGVAGVVGASMRKLTKSDFLIDGIKELTMWGLRGNAAVEHVPAMEAFPTDPLQWQNQATTRIKLEFDVVSARLEKWQRKAIHNDPNFVMNFDPLTAIEAALKVNRKPIVELEPVDSSSYADHFERAFWKRWLTKFAYSAEMSSTKVGTHVSKTENNGKQIKRRCEELGVDWRQYAKVSEDRVDRAAREKSGWHR